MGVKRIDTRFPLRFAMGSLFFIYILQYPVIRWLYPETPTINYSIESWVRAYIFVASSSIIFLISIKLGMNGRSVAVEPHVGTTVRQMRRPSMFVVSFIFIFFAAWSYLMAQLKIGMTIYASLEPLPFRLTGFMFYGRLFVQPFVLLYIAYVFQRSRQQWLIILLLLLIGAWASTTSGSRFIGIMFSLPLLLTSSGKGRWLLWLSGVSMFIIIATVSRHFYLPFIIGGEYIKIYANASYQAAVIGEFWMIPIGYLLGRVMGIDEVMRTLAFGDVTPTFFDAVSRLFSAFIPLLPAGAGASIKNIYGIDDDVFGGYGLDLFSNYWVHYGGNVITYGSGLLLTGWLLGKTYCVTSRMFLKVGLDGAFGPFIFVLLFLLTFEARAFLLPYILLFMWVAQSPTGLKLLFGLLGMTTSRAARLGSMGGAFGRPASGL